MSGQDHTETSLSNRAKMKPNFKKTTVAKTLGGQLETRFIQANVAGKAYGPHFSD